MGPAGPEGAAGAQGIAGPAGAVGPAGAIGPQGAQGAKGDKGDIGAVGPQGLSGDGITRGAAVFYSVGSPGPVGYSKVGTFSLKGAGKGRKAPSLTFDIYIKN